jgi:hypothetical protein
VGARRAARLQRRRLASLAAAVAWLCGMAIGFALGGTQEPLVAKRTLVKAESLQHDGPSLQQRATQLHR